jgi:hypothetical protein
METDMFREWLDAAASVAGLFAGVPFWIEPVEGVSGPVAAEMAAREEAAREEFDNGTFALFKHAAD